MIPLVKPMVLEELPPPSTIDEIVVLVRAEITVETSVVKMVNEIAKVVEYDKIDQDRAQQFANELKIYADVLAAAVIANTPVGPPTLPVNAIRSGPSGPRI